MNKATPNLGMFSEDESIETDYDLQCEAQYGTDKSCAGDETSAPVYLNGLFTDRASLNEKILNGQYYPTPDQEGLQSQDVSGAIPYVVDPWPWASHDDVANVTMATGEAFQGGSHPLGHNGDNRFRRWLAASNADPCDINNAANYFDTAGASPTKMAKDIPGYQQASINLLFDILWLHFSGLFLTLSPLFSCHVPEYVGME